MSFGREEEPPARLIDRSDVSVLLEASHALSSEIELSGLIEKLMGLAIERASAERGLLVLLREREPGIAARATDVASAVELVPFEPESASDEVPHFAIDWVMRTRRTLIVEDVAASEICRDAPYVVRHHPSSLLCLPIIRKTQLSGVLYLENRVVRRGFALDRITVLELLAAQAAISLENFYLYADLKRSEATLAEAQQISKIGSWVWNIPADKLSYSAENYRIHGLDPNTAAPPSMHALLSRIHPDDVAVIGQGIALANSQKLPLTYDYRVVLPDGSIKHLHSAGHPVLDRNGEPTHEYIGTTMDVTDRKRAEDALRDAQAELLHVTRVTTIGELASSIAHELNQPLTSIVANAQSCVRWLASERFDQAAAAKAAERVVRDANRASEIIRSIRGLLRKSSRADEPLAINDVIREIVDLMRSELRRNSVSLESALSEDVATVWGDRVQLQQVVVNLVLNGIEALNERAPSERVLRVRTQQHAGEVLVAVEDSGCGIDPSRLEEIFDTFVTSKPGGIGMGLAICRSVVAAHGGRIWSEAREGGGSIVQFSLPARAGSDRP